MENLERYFEQFRKNIVGIDTTFESPYGTKKIIYADWIASGRLYEPIENKIKDVFGPLVGNTHSEASETGVSMTHAYHYALKLIKNHVGATSDDIIITAGTGMTAVVNKLQRILGLKVPEQIETYCTGSKTNRPHCRQIPENERPVIFVTHMEHHSNHTSWLETIADVVVLLPDDELRVNPQQLREEIQKYSRRKLKIGSFSACSNVTGIMPPVGELARIMHENGGYCFVDFAASAPYLKMNMHPEDPMERLDAVLFSPHKFLGGPGSSGVLIFNAKLYKNTVPDHPGGGTVNWTDRWGQYSYLSDIESREDGGTPGFLQAMRTALSIQLKEKMGCQNIMAREEELKEIAFKELKKIKGLHLLAGHVSDRIGVFSFYIDNIHHNLIVKLLNDRFGVQVRGGCSCAGTYGHFLLDVSKEISRRITQQIDSGNLSGKPGWVRMSIHPTMTNAELYTITDALQQIVENIDAWSEEYYHSVETNEFFHKTFHRKTPEDFAIWFEL